MENQNKLIEQPSWWKRNWKWAVPVGGCFTIIIAGVVAVVLGVYTFADKIKTASGSDQAIRNAQENTRVIEVLGEPIESDGFGNISISIKNGVKTTNSSVPIKGPKGEATIHIISHEEGGKRVFDFYNVTIKGSDEVIELNPEDTLGENP